LELYYSLFGATPVFELLQFLSYYTVFELLQFLSYYAAFEAVTFKRPSPGVAMTPPVFSVLKPLL
jgi:hypothetical protein